MKTTALFNSALSQNVARWMALRGLSARQLSLRARLNETAVRDILTGRAKSPRYETLQALATVLDTTVEALTQTTPHEPVLTEPVPADVQRLTRVLSIIHAAAERYKLTPTPAQTAEVAGILYHLLSEKSPSDKRLLSLSKDLLDGRKGALQTYKRAFLKT